jgi:hypothetical protein
MNRYEKMQEDGTSFIFNFGQTYIKDMFFYK